MLWPPARHCNSPSTLPDWATHKESAQLCHSTAQHPNARRGTTQRPPPSPTPKLLSTSSPTIHHTTLLQHHTIRSFSILFAVNPVLFLSLELPRPLLTFSFATRPPVTATPGTLHQSRCQTSKLHHATDNSQTLLGATLSSEPSQNFRFASRRPVLRHSQRRIQAPSRQLMNQTHTQRPVRPHSLVY